MRTGGARERVPAALAVLGDVVDEGEVLVHRPRPAPELLRGILLLVILYLQLPLRHRRWPRPWPLAPAMAAGGPLLQHNLH